MGSLDTSVVNSGVKEGKEKKDPEMNQRPGTTERELQRGIREKAAREDEQMKGQEAGT